jgi:hypothetical protein
MTPDEILAFIKKCAAELGYVPAMPELEKTGRITRYQVDKAFGSYMRALKACGLKGRGCGFRVDEDDLFQEWALMVRHLGAIPNIHEYQKHSRRSIRPMLRCFKNWSKVPKGVMEYFRSRGRQEEWEDVFEIIRRKAEGTTGENSERSKSGQAFTSREKIHYKNTFYGPPLLPSVVTYAPINEIGLTVLFASMAKELGFRITHMQTEFPDGEVMREVEYGRWQRLRVEFEFESRNFVSHAHPADGCELIVCWNHNWAECPLEVLEMKSIVEKMRR